MALTAGARQRRAPAVGLQARGAQRFDEPDPVQHRADHAPVGLPPHAVDRPDLLGLAGERVAQAGRRRLVRDRGDEAAEIAQVP
jgi:hypothetical protein